MPSKLRPGFNVADSSELVFLCSSSVIGPGNRSSRSPALKCSTCAYFPTSSASATQMASGTSEARCFAAYSLLMLFAEHALAASPYRVSVGIAMICSRRNVSTASFTQRSVAGRTRVRDARQSVEALAPRALDTHRTLHPKADAIARGRLV
eukprot:CAMPEP_0198680084 /NCGR_PEP_ID=MMETSP1468-20131203/4005_1 /TAXON_ID=1461545 /ORGANISM="Mantoniella sp, Strain CCMP1436" /LENGTH=150 /DNA_ID=CAMNT_0044419719 /DNA_START=949 /DNA_END=1397 /DNA_ORIENTATION=-